MLIFLYFVWKIYSWFKRPEDRPLWIPISKIDIYTGMRDSQVAISGENTDPEMRRQSVDELREEVRRSGGKGKIMGVVRSIF